MNFSIIIPNYNGEKLLKSCLDSINITKPKIKIEIIVVDNGSTNPPKSTSIFLNSWLKKIFSSIF